jgi:hypothetical protein
MPSKATSPCSILVRLQEGSSWGNSNRFANTFKIGRSPECDLVIPVPAVSKVHAQVSYEEGRWWIIDLDSRNGTFLNGIRIDRMPLPPSCRVELGQGGAMLWLSLDEDASVPERIGENTYFQEAPESVTQLVKRLEGFQDTGEGGAQTRIYSEALKRITKRRSRRYQIMLGMIGLLLAGTAILAAYQHNKIERLRDTAGEIFYTMKRVELQIAQLEELVTTSAQAKEMQEILAKRQEIKALESKYDKFIKELGIYDPNMTEQDRAVFRIARRFGECEATMPKDFLAEVNKYIKKWKATERLINGVRRAAAAGYTGTISSAMFTNNLPPHFFYVALQGLLVLASYNWGEGNVIKMIKQLPQNPQDRNFWQLLKKFKIPSETYDYVFYIISAAVIGENPRLFGFDFPPPFASNLGLEKSGLKAK